MWSSNMAARWRGKEGDLNAGNSDFLCSNTPDEFTLCRSDVEMDPQSCMDHSILALFEDSAVSSEDKSGVEEENETLLSALTEMLDSVEDDDGTLSPFDTLPDTKLLTHQECRDKSAELYLTDRLRPRSKLPNLTLTMKSDGEKEEESKVEKNSLSQVLKQQNQNVSHPNTKKVDNEVEVFTSTSLVNLVKLMHPYCLKLHVEEEGKGTTGPSASSWDKVKKKNTLFSQGEVYKYERPTEDSDEEINVVSDDEAPAKETKEDQEGDGKRDDGKLLKSILLQGNSSRVPMCREKKRVSFGPVQTASLDESAGKELNETNQTSGITVSEALENPAGSALEAQTNLSSEINSDDKAEVLPPKAETKAKSLSLQQYRQLRQKRQPLVEKQGNYVTKWPSVSEAPKELTPILCLQGQRISTDHLHKPSSHPSALPSRPNPVEDKPSSRTCRSGSKCSKTESKIISPASPLADVKAEADVNAPESKKSPVKKSTLLSSDPPNPVLLPMPVTQTSPSPSPAHSSSKESKEEFLNRDSLLETTAHLQEIQNESTSAPSPTQPPSSSEPKPKAALPKQDRNLDSTALLQEIKNKLTEIVSGMSSRSPAPGPTTTQTESNSELKEPQPQKYSLNPTKDIRLEPKIPQSPCLDPAGQTECPSSTPCSSQPPATLNTPTPVKKTSPEVPSNMSPPEEPPPSPKLGGREQSAVGESGIEAPDLTSLLEQFEETQDKEEGECESEPVPKLVSAASRPNLQTHTDQHRTEPRGTEKTSKQLAPAPLEPLKPLSTSESPGTPKTIRNLPDLQTLQLTDIPEPLGTEIILSTQQAQPARRKNPPSKAIQIIDPRPLPSKKTNTSTSEFPAAHTAPHLYSSVSSDHDYCAPVDHSPTSATQHSRAKPSSLLKDLSKTTNEAQVNAHDSCATAECRKQTSAREVTTTVRAVNNSTTPVMQPLPENHRTRSETNPSTDRVLSSAIERDCCGASEDKTTPCTLPTPPPSPPSRGREKRRYRRRSPRSSSSSSSSASRSPKRPRLHHKRSESSSCSSSSSRSVSRSPPRRYRLSRSRSRCSRSRSRSWSQSRSPSRSPSPRTCHTRWRDVCSSRESRRLRREHEMRIQKLKAIDERRVVYVGRIRRTMTHDELRERFSQFGDVECVSLHFRDRGDHYGFVTFYNMEDAFAAIDNGGKLRKPDELPFDICFGGRRQFCKSNYADLDANRDAEESSARNRFQDLDFDSLLKQAQRGIKR